MKIVLDEDVSRVAEFMQREIAAEKLEWVASRLPLVAQMLWSTHSDVRLKTVNAFEIESGSSACELQPQQDAKQLGRGYTSTLANDADKSSSEVADGRG